MRITILAIAFFCALISGWTAALAQIQTIGGSMPSHHAQASMHQDSGSPAKAHCPTSGKVCEHPAQTVHPLLCAACFAVSVQTPDMNRDEAQAQTIRPQRQRPMRTSTVKPRFPPPKAFLLI